MVAENADLPKTSFMSTDTLAILVSNNPSKVNTPLLGFGDSTTSPSWKGNTFTGIYSGTDDGLNFSYKVSGTISSDGLSMTNITYDGTMQVQGTNYNNTFHIEISSIKPYSVIWSTNNNSPLSYIFGGLYYVEGDDDLAANITNISGQIYNTFDSQFYDIVSLVPNQGVYFRFELTP